MKRVFCEVKNISPLLFNRIQEDTLLNLRDKTKKKKFSTRPKDPREEAAPKVHQTKDGKPYIPANMLMSALIGAGMYIRLDGKRQLSTLKSSLVPGFITLEDHYCLLTNGKKNGIPKWEVDMQPGRNPNGGELVCIVRPRFDVWGFKFSLIVDDDSFPVDRVRELVDIALLRQGLGDFRPSKKGTYGKSVVTKWKEEAIA